jgi:hypothetical protein
MRDDWELVIHGPTLSFLLSCRATERRLILKFCDQLVSNPPSKGITRKKTLLAVCSKCESSGTGR